MAEKKQDKEKPLDKMTVKELREIALQIPDIVGVHGMNKGDLVEVIKEFRGIKDEGKKKNTASLRDIKGEIKACKAKRAEALEKEDRKTATIMRRKISRLKKKTRRAA